MLHIARSSVYTSPVILYPSPLSQFVISFCLLATQFFEFISISWHNDDFCFANLFNHLLWLTFELQRIFTLSFDVRDHFHEWEPIGFKIGKQMFLGPFKFEVALVSLSIFLLQ